MASSPFVFAGHPAYLEAAAADLGRPELALAAGRLVAVSALANLCAQASRTEAANVPPILAKACEFRDQLAIALQAADAMIAAVESATSLQRESETIEEKESPLEKSSSDEAARKNPPINLTQHRPLSQRKGRNS